MRKSILACILVALVVGAGSATAASLITSSQIQDGTIQNRDVRKGVISMNRLTPGVQAMIKRGAAVNQTALSQQRPGSNGAPGPAGPKGDTGAKGDQGDRGIQGLPGTNPGAGNWGIVNRNTIGSPVAALRSGPADPPLGDGALQLIVRGQPDEASTTASEKIAYGNEIDFVGRLVSSIDEVGFRVHTTGENNARGNPNMPGITFEIDPNLAAAPASNYSSLVFLAPNSTSNVWSPYINAATQAASPSGTGWYLTGAAGTTTGCLLSAPCTWTQVQTALNDPDGSGATVLSVAITKGRDYGWQGAVDGLRIGNTVFDFEEDGVFAGPAS